MQETASKDEIKWLKLHGIRAYSGVIKPGEIYFLRPAKAISALNFLYFGFKLILWSLQQPGE